MARHAYRIISADSHTLEPPDLWKKWLESKYLETAPKLVEDKDGGHAWVYMGGNTPEPLGLVSCAGIRDFPHHGNDWPYSRRTIEQLFVGVPDEERCKIVCENAARFWRL